MHDLSTFFASTSSRVEATAGVGATLPVGTYYADLCDLGGEVARLTSAMWLWDAALIASIIVEATNFSELAVYAAAATGWKQLTTIPTLTIAGGSAGVDCGSWADQGFGRLRAKLAVTQQGLIRGAVHHKRG